VEKLDLKKQWRHLYIPSAKKVELVDVPELNFVMIDGVIEAGDSPGTSAGFQQTMQALYGAAYTLKFTSKLSKTNPINYPVMALEGLWSVQSGQFDFSNKEAWQYTLMIMQPDHITGEMLAAAVQQLRKKRGDNPALARLRLERFREGLCIQVMHLGPYANEPETIERMKAFARENGYTHRGRHHEIYLGDPRSANPETLKTVLRQPVEKAT
jgi:hypothetical protein